MDEVEKRARARMLSRLLLVLMPVFFALALTVRYIVNPSRGWSGPGFLVALSLAVLTVVALFANRRGHYSLAATTSIVTVLAGVFLANHFTLSGLMEPTFNSSDIGLLAYLVVPTVMAAALLPLPLLATVTLLSLGGVLLVPVWYPHVSLIQVVSGPLQFIVVVLLLLTFVSYFLYRYERQSAQQLTESEHRFRSLFEQSLDPVFIVDVDGIVRDVNDAVTRVFGYSPAFLVGRHIKTVYADPGERTRIIESVQRDGYLHDEPLKLRASDDSIRDCLVTIWPRRGPDGRMLEYQTIVRDVTEYLRAKEERQIRGDLIELAFVPVFLVDPGGEIVYANEALAVLTGYSPEELVGMNVRTLNTPEAAEEVPSRIALMLREGGLEFETRWVCKDGTRVSLEIRTRTIDSGGRTLFLSVARDVTRRKQDEAQLRLRSELLDLTSDAVFLHDLQGRFLYVNEAAAAGRGYTRDELMRMSLLDIAQFADGAQFHNRVAELVAKGSLAFESRHRHKDGRLISLEVRSRLIEIDGRPMVLSVARDVDKRKRAEEELRESERKYRELFEQSMDAVAVFSVDGTLLDANPAHMRLFGNTKEDVGRRVVLQHYVDSSDRDEFIRILERDGVVVDQEVRLRKKDGTEMDCIRTAVAVRDAEGHVSRIQTVTRDVTERKRVEQDLRDREEKYRQLFEQSMDAVALVSTDGTLLEANQACLSMFGWSTDSIGRVNVSEAYVDPSQREEFLRKLDAEERIADQEVNLKRTDGTELVCLRSAVARRDESGRMIAIQVVVHDITAWKQTQRELEESELRFRTLIENAGVGILMTRLTGEILDCNEAARRMFGYGRDEFLSLNVSQLYAKDPDRERVLDKFRKQGFLRAEVIEFQRKDGSLLYLALTSARVPLQGEHIVMSELLNFTEQRMAEEELRASRERLQLLTMYLEDARERERTGIARELHDQLGQALTALSMDLNTITARVEKGQPVSPDSLKEMSRLVDEMSQDVRRISSELRPGMLDDIGLVSALEWQLTQWALRMGVEYDFLPEADDANLDRARSTALFRVFQEVLTNVARHAGATHVQVSFTNEDDRAVLTVKDNGRGITEGEINHAESLGIVGMRERIRPLGGSLDITGVPGKGTTVVASVPTGHP
ncbi:MAG: PAS domain S-box protein [Chloroflexota bacterium]